MMKAAFGAALATVVLAVPTPDLESRDFDAWRVAHGKTYDGKDDTTPYKITSKSVCSFSCTESTETREGYEKVTEYTRGQPISRYSDEWEPGKRCQSGTYAGRGKV